ncbi:MAG TPA: histidine triad nucleotide-binding protein [bacterium]
MTGCLFCKIVAGEIPAQRVYEDDVVIAIRDINPQAPVHVLILPRRHLASVSEIEGADPELMHRIGVAAATLAAQEGIAERGYRLLTNTGPDGGQAVAHLHFHLLGGRAMGWPPG